MSGLTSVPNSLTCQVTRNLDKGEARIDIDIGQVKVFINFGMPCFSESCSYMYYFSGDGVLYILLMILVTKWYA